MLRRLQEPVDDLEQHGGAAAPLVVLDVDHAAVLRPYLGRLLGSASSLVLRAGSPDRRGALKELVALVGRADRHREQPDLVTAGLRRYQI